MRCQNMTIAKRLLISMLLISVLMGAYFTGPLVFAANSKESEEEAEIIDKVGGGYAASNQLKDFGYTTEKYDANHGLPTSEANCVLGAKDGYVWVGGYSGIFKYDGSFFERLDSTDGLTSGRCIFEDSKGRIWIGTNDNGAVVINNRKQTRFTIIEGLPSSCVRSFAEDQQGNILVGTSQGLAYIDKDLKLNRISDSRIDYDTILRLSMDGDGRVFGYSKSGYVFMIEDCKISNIFSGEDLGIEPITTILANPTGSKVYLGTGNGHVYYGYLGTSVNDLRMIDVAPLDTVQLLGYECDRVWVLSNSQIGYLDEYGYFNLLQDLPPYNDISMISSDYQGNLWFSSTTQGVMKLVTSNFYNIIRGEGIDADTVYANYFYEENLYIGTEKGLFVVATDAAMEEKELTEYIGDAKVRHVNSDSKGNVWVATFTNDLGLVCKKPTGEIVSFNTENGLPSNQVRFTFEASDGRLLVASNGGFSCIKDYQVLTDCDPALGTEGFSALTIVEKDGEIYIGTDGNGIFIVSEEGIRHLGVGNGLSSDVVMRIKWDERWGVFWIITSNSIQYIKDNVVNTITSFPYSCNYDLYYDMNDNIWVLSSNGIYCVNGKDMVDDSIENYRLYTPANGLPCMPTANAYSVVDPVGNLYVAGTTGICKLNIDDFVDEYVKTKFDIHSFYCDGQEIFPDENGKYIIPAGTSRISIMPAIFDYSESNPFMHMCLEGVDEGITRQLSNMIPLEYTGLKYGDYKLHIQILNNSGSEVLQEKIFDVEKKPKLYESFILQFLIVSLISFLAGLLAWYILSHTVVRRQYVELQEAKEELSLAKSAKARLFANVSAELRTPISTIMGMNELTLKRKPQGDINKYVDDVTRDAQNIKTASEKLLRFVDSLLTISKLESESFKIVEREYVTVDRIKNNVAMIRDLCQEKGLDFDVQIDDKLPLGLYGDVGKINQITVNLFSNAVKYTNKGKITFRVSVDNIIDDKCYMRFSVKDTGDGIPKDKQQILFNVFEGFADDKSPQKDALGLGLSISKKYADILNGQLWFETEEGNGSEFIFAICQKITDFNTIGSLRDTKTEITRGEYVPDFIAPDAEVLIVDNDVISQEILVGLLSATKMYISIASTGEECLEMVKFGNYNIVLVDYMLPDMDGDDLVGRIREFSATLPVYALSANSTEDEEFYKSKGFDGFFTKPVNREDLERTIMKELPDNIFMNISNRSEKA